ncbi:MULTISPECIES: hypothetical protein [Anoxybacillaceae]|uniref:YqzN/YkzM domain-containing protein n=1 Tax=Parageobacillus thermoglucosidasius TaxID=1426 RepID=A0A178TWV0_PARTM|nr:MULTISPECIES: hypothetical protein [Bacillaceae]EID42859.1 putative phage protein [Parageobacillus thermoglucosidasius TNO-09.020]KYD17857.1 hypothetical protein B4168_2418 [Anoxybacillus flavithermus]OAO85362.1 hypothetical protein GT23_3053 [Parageobacillus thermoglucosidasius]OAT71879.1 hypothetical protein A7K69_10740 [Parageobacillus thermoglucosidasius]
MAEKKVENVKEEQEFFLYELRQHSQKLFGVKPEVFDGAFFDYKETRATKKEAEKRIQAFLKKEVRQ